jgi:Fe-S-cluster-containing dehydrogenase component
MFDMPQMKGQWRSFEDFADAAVAPSHEEFSGPWNAHAPDRREAMKLMAAAWALGGLRACSDAPDEHLIPAVKVPSDAVARAPGYYSGAFVHEGFAAGTIVRHWMGRPIKVEGNPRHPASLGATDAMAQAQILDFYNPERAWGVTRGGTPSTLIALQRALAEQREALAASGGEGFVILSGATTSPTLAAQLENLRRKYPGLRWLHWEPISRAQAQHGAILAYGRPVGVTITLANADVVLSIDSDLLSAAPGSVRYARDFASRRNPTRTAKMSRLYAIEPTPTVTGAVADHRFAAGPRDLRQIMLALAATVLERPGPEGPTWIAPIADDLKSHWGRALIHVGPDQPAEMHSLVFAMNEALGARGATFDLIEPLLHPSSDSAFSLPALVEEMNAGRISSLVILDSNPIYAASHLGFAEAVKRVAFTLALAPTPNETSDATLWAAPMAHSWESWSDARAYDGTISILQPQALPLYGGMDQLRLISLLVQPNAAETSDLVKQTWQPRFGATFNASWREALAEGLIADSASLKSNVRLRADAGNVFPPEASGETPMLHSRPDPYLWDGRYADNAWLQELPRPLTKMTWDNPLLVSPEYARRMSLRDGDIMEFAVGARTVTTPIYVMPGQADDCIVALLGFGRRRVGAVGDGVGVDFFPFIGAVALSAVRKIGPREPLARTDHHHPLNEEGGRYARSDTLADFLSRAQALSVNEEGPFIYRWKPQGPVAWGMSVDLNACVGCGACVVACQAENNIPTVGKDEVLRQREMHWLRIDRYYEGAPAKPKISFQPILCMHCEQAPCEPVCPVGATVHDSEGLNVMVYNRCIGTRFCSNNCPYKVRRFNYFAFAEEEKRPIESRNPDVTVRARGVMEKCSFCIQRIAQARIDADKENHRTAEIETACQAACPTRAFSFGDLAAQGSEVAQRKRSPLTYALLEDQNTVPRVTYEKRVLNENPKVLEAGE